MTNESEVVYYRIPTLLVTKILGYCIYEWKVKEKLKLLLLSKHLHQLLKPTVISYITFDIATYKDIKDCLKIIVEPKRINTDYFKLIQTDKPKHNLFNSLQHLCIIDTISHLRVSVIPPLTITTINSLHIEMSGSQEFDQLLYILPSIQHLSLKTTLSANHWCTNIVEKNIVLQALHTLSLPADTYRGNRGACIGRYISKMPTLTTFVLYDFSPVYNCSKVPATITHLQLNTINNYQFYHNSSQWVISKANSIQHLTLTGVTLTSSLCKILKMTKLKTLTINERSHDIHHNIVSYRGHKVTDDIYRIWYQEFYHGVRDSFVYDGIDVHIVIKDMIFEEELMREYEHLGGVLVHLLNNGGGVNHTMILNRDDEWVKHNIKKLKSFNLPVKAIAKILVTKNLLLNRDLFSYSTIDKATLNYVRESMVIERNIVPLDSNIFWWSKYSILSTFNIKSIELSTTQIEECSILNRRMNYNNQNNEILFPNLEYFTLHLDINEVVPFNIFTTIPNLKTLNIAHYASEDIHSEDDETETINKYSIGKQLFNHVEKHKSQNLLQQQQDHLSIPHKTLRELIFSCKLHKGHWTHYPHYITNVSFGELKLVSPVGRIANLKHINISQIPENLLDITTKIIMNYFKKNQFQRLESIIISIKEHEDNNTQVAKKIYSIIKNLSNIKSLESLVFIPHQFGKYDIQDIRDQAIDFSPFKLEYKDDKFDRLELVRVSNH